MAWAIGLGAAGACGDGKDEGAEVQTEEATCDAPPVGPLEAEVFVTRLSGSEDMSFDGLGHLVARQSDDLVRIGVDGHVEAWGQISGITAGMRFAANGELHVAYFLNARIDAIDDAGNVREVARGLAQPNGLFPDADGSVYITETGGRRIRRLNPDGTLTPVVTDVSSPNGIALDHGRGLLFFTEIATNKLRKAAILDASADAGGFGPPEDVAQLPDGSEPDGVALDACGHAYIVGNGDRTLYRVQLDEGGVARSEPEVLATFNRSVANPVFGHGTGFNPRDLYIIGFGGTIFRVHVGLAGAPPGF